MVSIESLDVAMVYYGDSPHPSHAGFANSVGADLVRCPSMPRGGKLVEALYARQLDYDILISEGTRPLVVALGANLFSDTKIIYLCADEFFYRFTSESNLPIYELMYKKTFASLFNKSIDGILAVSDFAAGFMRSIVGSSVPIRVAHPYIENDLYSQLDRTEPNLGARTAITASSIDSGAGGGAKGVDILVSAWPKVRKNVPDATLYVAGSGHPDEYTNQPGVELLGYVDPISSAMSRAGLYVQPSRGDAYPVAVLEALRAGLPAIVTNSTGSRSIIREIAPGMVCDPTPDSLATAITDYFTATQAYRRSVSTAAAQRGKEYDAEKRKSGFRIEFEKMIADM